MRRLVLAWIALLVVGCGRTDAPKAEPAAAEPQKTQEAPLRSSLPQTKYGGPITETQVTPLASLVASPSDFHDKTVRTEGVVKSVCQNKGCWMQIGDEAGAAHVKFAGYGFFVPKNASGHRAVVQGHIVPSKDTCSGKDGCREKGERASGVVAKVDFEATGVEFVD